MKFEIRYKNVFSDKMYFKRCLENVAHDVWTPIYSQTVKLAFLIITGVYHILDSTHGLMPAIYKQLSIAHNDET